MRRCSKGNPSRHDLARQIEQLDGQIDGLVYKLYGLGEEEIEVVEGV